MSHLWENSFCFPQNPLCCKKEKKEEKYIFECRRMSEGFFREHETERIHQCSVGGGGNEIKQKAEQ